MASKGKFAPVLGGESDSDVQYAQLSIDPVTGAVLGVMGPDGLPTASFGATLVAGAGTYYPTISGATNSVANRFSVRKTPAGAEAPIISATFTNGSTQITTTGTFDMEVNLTPTYGTPLNDFFYLDGRYYKIKVRVSATELTLYEQYAGVTGLKTGLQYQKLAPITVVVLPGEYPEMVALPSGVFLAGLGKIDTIAGFDSAFASGAVMADNGISNMSFGPTEKFGSLENFAIGPCPYVGGNFLLDNVTINLTNLNNAHAGGNLILGSIPGGVVTIKNSDIILGGHRGNFGRTGNPLYRSRVEFLSTTIHNSDEHQSGGVSGGYPITALDDTGYGTDYHDFYFRDFHVVFKDTKKNPSIVTALGIGSVHCGNANNTWNFDGFTSSVVNNNAAAANINIESPICLFVEAGEVRINHANLNASGTNNAGAAGRGILCTGGTLYLENTTITGDKYALEQTGGTVIVGKGVVFNGPMLVTAGFTCVNPGGTSSIAYAATVTPNANIAEVHNIGILTGNITVANPTNPQAGQRLVLNYTQDAVGARVITYGAAFKSSAIAAALANQKGSQNFVYDGTNWVQSGGALTWV